MSTCKPSPSKWPGSLREARRSVFLREPPPVSEGFFSWFQHTFPTIAQSSDPALVTRLVYGAIFQATKGKEFPLAYSLLEPFLKADTENEAGGRSRSVLPIVEDLSTALGVPFNHHSIDLHLARCIQQFTRERATDLLTEWQRFALPPSDPKAVHCITKEKTVGTKYKSTLQRAKGDVQAAETKAERNITLRRIVGHLHHPLPKVLLTRTEERILAVETERNDALQLVTDDTARDQLWRTYSLRLRALHGCRANACGGYIWSRRSENYRLFTAGDTLVTIQGEDRRAITRRSDGFVEFDLASAHLAIGNFLFGGPELTKLLQSKAVWATLLKWIGYEPEDKPVLKACIYAMTYGSGSLRQCSLLVRDPISREQIAYALDLAKRKREAGQEPVRARNFTAYVKDRLRTFLKQDEEAQAACNKLVQHPAVQELLVNRDRYSREILSAGGAKDAFDDFQRIFETPSRTIATLASSYEKWLLWPIYEKAFSRRDFEVVLDQHDGLTIRFTRQDDEVRMNNLLLRLQQAVQERADKLGILTHLEIKNS